MIYISNFDPTDEQIQDVEEAIAKLSTEERDLIKIHQHAMPPEMDDFDYDYASAQASGLWCVVSIRDDRDLVRRFFNLWCWGTEDEPDFESFDSAHG